MTKAQLQKELDKLKVPYKATDNKKKLEKALKKANKPNKVVPPVIPVPPVVETPTLPVVETKQPDTKSINRSC